MTWYLRRVSSYLIGASGPFLTLCLSGYMNVHGTIRLDKKTKNLAKRLQPGEIALIDHMDIDAVSAEMLLERGVVAVVNASSSISGRYPNAGPKILLEAGVPILDCVGEEVFGLVRENDRVVIEGSVLHRKGTILAEGEELTLEKAEKLLEAARENLGNELHRFVENTLSYVEKEKAVLLDVQRFPELRNQMRGKHVLMVIRGPGFKDDLQSIRGYLREVKPVLVGVDGGADALLAMGLKPHIIVGDMDSVSDEALHSGAELIVHGYTDGRPAPGLARVEKLDLPCCVIPLTGTSEDLAMLLTYEKGAELIVAVGSHSSLEDFLDKGRGGMSSTFLVRLKVGARLVDAKGVNRLYRAKPRKTEMLMLGAACALLVITVLAVSPAAQDMLQGLLNNLRVLLLKLRFIFRT